MTIAHTLSDVVPARAGTHTLGIEKLAGWGHLQKAVFMGPRFRGDDNNAGRSQSCDRRTIATAA